jgi:creatinine amidohydrolase
MKHLITTLFTVIIFISSLPTAISQINEDPLLLSEMTWVEVQTYLEVNDMVIIPLGSIEQHGRHLPTGTDYFSAIELSKKISAKADVIVAPVLLVGYSKYHSGFPGTLSISPETMEKVVFECVESLIKHGFKRFMFFNAHGGNKIVQEKLIHRINSTTGANAVSLGHGSPIWPTKRIDYFDWHAGKFETSLDLCLFPELVQIEKAEKPIIHFTEEIEKIKLLSEDYPELNRIWEGSMIFLPEETGKGSAVHEISSNGVISFNDPKDASTEYGKPFVDDIVNSAVALIKAWKLVE